MPRLRGAKGLDSVPHKTSSAGSNIGELLLREGLITNAQLDLALTRQKETDMPLVRILVDSGNLDETKRLNFFKRQFGIPLVSLESVKLDPILYTYIPAHIARRHHLVPVKLDRDGLVVAMEDPSNLVLIDNLKEVVGLRIKPVVASTTEIMEALAGYPDEPPPAPAAAKAEKFDFAARFFGYLFLPIMSSAVLLTIFGLLLWNEGFQRWLRVQFEDPTARSSQIFTMFLYFFLTWGVWTIIMYEVRGLVFDDLQWREDDEAGEPRRQRKALLFGILFGWLGIDRFYLGYKRMGILKLLTFGLLGIWWVLDILLLLGKSVPDAAGRPLE
jgi:hypothetical protein